MPLNSGASIIFRPGKTEEICRRFFDIRKSFASNEGPSKGTAQSCREKPTIRFFHHALKEETQRCIHLPTQSVRVLIRYSKHLTVPIRIAVAVDECAQ